MNREEIIQELTVRGYHAESQDVVKNRVIKEDHLTQRRPSLGLQKSSDEDICKELTEFEEIEQYIYVRIDSGDGKGSIKLIPAILERVVVVKHFWVLSKVS